MRLLNVKEYFTKNEKEKKMGILDTLKKKILATPSETTATPSPAALAKAAALVGSKAAPKELSPAEVEEIIAARVRAKGNPSNWKVSIVDLMTALDMNSSLDSRRALAAKLNYSGYAADGSAEKNLWLHAELLKALAKNEGKVPSNLL
jgi:hypothetical protein